jgi:hypothetical protein
VIPLKWSPPGHEIYLMAKSKNVTRLTKKKVKKSKSRKGSTSLDKIDSYGAAAGRMYEDPCGAELVPSVYPGDRGYVNRFVYNRTLAAGAGQTCAVWIIKPGNTISAPVEPALPTTALGLLYGNEYPGNAFFAANAVKTRCTGFCVSVRPIAAPNNVTGTLHFGVINAASVPNALSTTAQGLAQLCTESISMSQAAMAPLEVKWCPGGFDDRYSPIWSSGFSGDDDSDRNVIIIVALGLPAATGVQFRATAIQEWTPKVDLGVVQDATAQKPSICDKDCILRNLKRKDPDWWWSLGKKAYNVGAQLATGYYTGGPIGMMGAATRFL